MKKLILSICLLFALSSMAQQPIDRKKVVERNNPHVTTMDSLNSLSVGNGGFAMTVDGTGLQSFPKSYSLGVPLGTMSDWGWHSFANPENYQPEESWRYYDFGRGRKEPYATQVKDNKRAKAAGDWYRVNPHRLHLGTLGLSLGADPKQIKQIDQTLNMWEGMIKSSFIYKGKAYQVETTCDPVLDMIATHIQSKGTIAVDVRFAYPTGGHCDDACDWTKDKLHSTTLVAQTSNSAVLKRIIDETVYFVMLRWQGAAKLKQKGKNFYQLQAKSSDLKLTCEYAEQTSTANKTFAEVADAAKAYWMGYWKKGGMADFSNCKDPRAKEMERRVVLSQYLLAIQDAGDTPPQETGLTYNSWFGKFHLEMTWWHLAHYGLWNKPECMEKCFGWFLYAQKLARQIAKRQGFNGIRWMKMTDPSGIEAPSNVGSYLIWQQPHFIYLAELLYRAAKSSAEREELLKKYAGTVNATALFMADFAEYDSIRDRYILRGCIPAQETLKADSTINPPFELSYWHTALQMAEKWRQRSGIDDKGEWDSIINKLSPLAFNEDSLYLAAETAKNTYTDIRFTSDHPALLGALGMMPDSKLINKRVMAKTLDWIWDNWNWDKTWGWDYPMVAMTCARLGQPSRAIDALLMNKRTNTYLVNGHNYQDGRLRVYMPGNGGLLTAVAMMCAGWDGATTKNPGFPKDWNVKWEGLLPMP